MGLAYYCRSVPGSRDVQGEAQVRDDVGAGVANHGAKVTVGITELSVSRSDSKGRKLQGKEHLSTSS